MKTGKIVIASLITALALTGCANVSITVNNDKVSPAADVADSDRQSVTGPYGQLSIAVPDDWDCKICPMDNDDMSYGYYGFIIHPADKKDGIVAIFCANRFGVCGTGLKQEETQVAGMPAWIGTYDDHKRWDYIVIGDSDPQIVVTGGACDSWTDDQWDMARTIVESVEFDPSAAEGAVWQYTPESEDMELGVSMDMSNITPGGATLHFYSFDTGNAGELSYGESFILERENEGKWEAVQTIVDEAAFTDIAYIIPQNDTSETEVNWEWLYGRLEPGTYRITKTVMNRTDEGNTAHELKAQFLIAGGRF